ncbi:phycobilisome linker polypeptide [Calothrix sp. NIES-3974]|uniref:phycobilisome linker polypeptide n=1 Tax=Calothrix sp. NIES-3974 TaxID=2005462 RepID=UPI000B6100F0|nr:phycobilisome linker polypeptide [Calothrix sp. NIES-3974]BAZ07820.1 CpcD phycobilisome linker domain protein [Calothrix sp. NIES-3974]
MLGTKLFRYEVAGLKQSDETDNLGYQIRSSANTIITVPYNRMNSEMRRITRMGGKIVSIQPVSAAESTENHDNN